MTTTNHSLGGAVAQARRRAGVDMSALATLIGTDELTLSAIEAGRERPTPAQLLHLCIHLGEDLGFFTGEHGSIKAAAA